MTQAQHTPGPWTTYLQTVKDGWICGPDGTFVACAVRDTQTEANARLIAAAPDLLATLQYVLLAHQYQGALTTGDAALSPAIAGRIERAIAQATGEAGE